MLARFLHRSGAGLGYQSRCHGLLPDTAANADFSSKIANAFSKNPELTGRQILGSLDSGERLRLLEILHSQNGTAAPEPATQAASR